MMELSSPRVLVQAYPVQVQSRPPFVQGLPQSRTRLSTTRVPAQVLTAKPQTRPHHVTVLPQSKQAGSIAASVSKLSACGVAKSVLPTASRVQVLSSPPTMIRNGSSISMRQLQAKSQSSRMIFDGRAYDMSPAVLQSTAAEDAELPFARRGSHRGTRFPQMMTKIKHVDVEIPKFASTMMSASAQDEENCVCSGKKRFVKQYTKADLSQLAPHIHSTVQRLTDCLQDRNKLKHMTVHLFKQAATDDSDSCPICKVEDTGLDLLGLAKFVELVSTHLDVPPYAFGDLDDLFANFDLTGQGSLNVNGAYRLVKSFLWRYREELGGEPLRVKIPWQSPSEGGYDVVKELGHGNQGVAKLARSKDGYEICLKVFQKEKMDEKGVQQLLKEFNAMRMLGCEVIAGTHALFQDEQFYYIATDLLEGGDLSTLTIKAEEQGVTMSVAWWRNIFQSCIAGLAFMHGQGMMHCDIKESNIMLKSADFSSPQPVIIDLGVCKPVAKLDDGIPFGTPGYVPPETLTDLRWYPRGDIFALGVTIFQVLCHMRPPSSGIFLDGCNTTREIFQATIQRDPNWERFPASFPELKGIAASMLSKDRMQRPRAPALLTHDWFTVAEPVGKDAIPMSGVAKGRKELYALLKPCNDFASMGITRDMVVDLDKK